MFASCWLLQLVGLLVCRAEGPLFMPLRLAPSPCRSIRKSTLLFQLFALIGALALCLYPLLLLGTPSKFICNLRSWFSNGGLILILRCASATPLTSCQCAG